LLCSGLLGVGCMGGPISDWPPRNGGEPTSDSDDDESQGDDDSADDSADDDTPPSKGDDDGPPRMPPSGGSKIDAGTKPPGSADAGWAPSMDAGTPTGPIEPGDGGGADAALDPGAACTPMSDGRAQGACFGSYCRMSPGALSESVQEGAACSGADELERACDGTIARAVAECAQREALSIGMGRAILGCARRTKGLTEVAEGCLSCYVEEVVCSVRSCLAACLDGASEECGACRAERCGDRFLACSGLPAPEGPAPSIPADGGMSLAACTPGADQTCNDNPAISSLHGRCRHDGTCVCSAGFEQNPLSGRCR
jgi:hypothetical protein